MRVYFAFLAGVLSATSICAQQPSSHRVPAVFRSAPDDIYFNGTIYTGNGFDTDKPEIVQAIAIGGGKVLAVGTTAQLSRLAGPKTQLHDLSSGGFIFPGLN